jgi:hypothetical protein
VLTTSAWASAQDFQVGARAKGMGGSYTAFEDDPISIWLNPAGIATQATQLSVAYQTFTQYEPDSSGVGVETKSETGWVDPPFIPSFLGLVVPIGTAENPMAVGIAYIRPFHMKLSYAYGGGTFPDSIDQQQFSRYRLAFAYDLKLGGKDSAFLPHIAFGVGVDIGYTKWEELYHLVGGDLVNNDTATNFGAGGGILLGLYDNTDDLKVNLGVAYQSKVAFQFQVDSDVYPVWDWPAMLNVGLTVYLLSGMPLRLTVDLQWIDWKNAVEEANPVDLPGVDDFRSVTNVSVGGEYRLNLKDDGSLLLYPRAGVRFLQTPWDDTDMLPGTGSSQLAIDTKDDHFTVLSLGAGLYWTTKDGKSRGIDLGYEIGGDSWNLAFGYTHEF